MSRTRIAVLGAGNWGRNHVRTIAALPDADLVAVCEVDRDRREAIAAQYPGVPVLESVDDAIDLADGVVVATPAATHAEIGLRVIERGKPVLIEKPMALSATDAAAIEAAAAARGVPVVAGHLLLFHPAIEYLRGLIVGQDLGQLYYLYTQRVNLGQVRKDENALWSFGPHDISVAMFLVGERPVAAAAQGMSYLQPGVEDVVFLILKFASGAVAHVHMSWLDPHKERRLTLVGSRKMAVFDDMEAREKVKIYDKGVDRPPDYGSYGESLAIREGDIRIPRIPNVEPLRAELQHFVQVIRGEQTARSGAADGLDVVRVLEAASTSLVNRGEMVKLEPSAASGM